MRYYIKALKNYASFKGRANRKEFWMYQLFLSLIIILAAVLDNILGTTYRGEGYGIFYSVVVLFHLIPSISIIVRRLHDIDKSGWYLLLIFVPLIGPILLLIWALKPGTPGDNRFGPPSE